MLVLDINDRAWWYWLASAICLWLAISHYPEAYAWAVGITVIQLIHYRMTEGSFSKFSVQVRIAYLAVLLVALPEAARWFLWLPAVGTLLRVSTGYCFLARSLMLLSFNRQVKLSWRFVRQAYLTPPVQGTILHKLP